MLLFDDFAPDPTAPLLATAPSRSKPRAKPAAAPIRQDSHPETGALIRIVAPLPAKTRGVLVTLHGTDGPCAMILRTSAMRADQCYQAALSANTDQGTVNLLMSDFIPIGGILRALPRPETLHSYAILPGSNAGKLCITRVRFY